MDQNYLVSCKVDAPELSTVVEVPYGVYQVVA